MSNTITLTDEQMKEFESTGSITLKMPEKKVEKWEPEGGRFVVQSNGTPWEFSSEKSRGSVHANFGTSFRTRRLADEAIPHMRRNNLLIQFVQEHGGIQEFVLGKVFRNWAVRCVNGKYEACSYSETHSLNEIFMTKECAKLLADKLNKREVEL